MTQTSRRALLFICPIMPQQSGNGLAMRAGLMLEGLARRFDVYLFVAPVSGGSLETPDFVRKLTVRVGVLALGDSLDPLAALIGRVVDPAGRQRLRSAYPRPWASRFCGLAAAQQAVAFLAGAHIDLLHVMRLYLAPLAVHILRTISSSTPLTLLDLDDDDVRVHQRLAALHELRGDAEQAEINRMEAEKYAACAVDVLSRFSAVVTSSEDDARRLAASNPTVRFGSVPNGYAADPKRSTEARIRGTGGSIRLLFVANLGYFPNADAAAQLVNNVVPALRKRGADVHLDIVGGGASAEMLGDWVGTKGNGGIIMHGAVESVASWYGQADIAVMPLRVGGGTRIKILEAFAYGVPVVSSHLGAEGLNAVDGKHLLCADNVTDFTSACLRLVADPALADDLVANADELLLLNYTPDRVHARLDAIVDSLAFRPANPL
jgi:glycosyltransferase involved in cell wall biosynthesis